MVYIVVNGEDDIRDIGGKWKEPRGSKRCEGSLAQAAKRNGTCISRQSEFIGAVDFNG